MRSFRLSIFGVTGWILVPLLSWQPLGAYAQTAPIEPPSVQLMMNALANANAAVVGIRVIARHRALVLKVSSQEKSFAVRTHQLLIVNGRYVAGPIAAAPDASVQDHAFDVFVLGGAHKGTLLRATWNWLTHRHLFSPENRYFTTKKLRVESQRCHVQANVDGDINDQTPLDLEILPSALRVVVPWGFDGEKV